MAGALDENPQSEWLLRASPAAPSRRRECGPCAGLGRAAASHAVKRTEQEIPGRGCTCYHGNPNFSWEWDSYSVRGMAAPPRPGEGVRVRLHPAGQDPLPLNSRVHELRRGTEFDRRVTASLACWSSGWHVSLCEHRAHSSMAYETSSRMGTRPMWPAQVQGQLGAHRAHTQAGGLVQRAKVDRCPAVPRAPGTVKGLQGCRGRRGLPREQRCPIP